MPKMTWASVRGAEATSAQPDRDVGRGRPSVPSPATRLFRLRVTERRPDVEGPAEDVVDGRSARPLLHDLLFLLRELALSGDVELHGAKRFLPVHRVFRARDRARINVEVRSNLEPFEVDALPGAVQRDG